MADVGAAGQGQPQTTQISQIPWHLSLGRNFFAIWVAAASAMCLVCAAWLFVQNPKEEAFIDWILIVGIYAFPLSLPSAFLAATTLGHWQSKHGTSAIVVAGYFALAVVVVWVPILSFDWNAATQKGVGGGTTIAQVASIVVAGICSLVAIVKTESWIVAALGFLTAFSVLWVAGWFLAVRSTVGPNFLLYIVAVIASGFSAAAAHDWVRRREPKLGAVSA